MAVDRSHPDPNLDAAKIPGSFRTAFAAALADVGLTVKQWQGINVTCTDANGEERSLSLGNIYRRAQNADRADWPAIITEFVQSVTEATEQEVLPENLDDVADQVMVRVGQPFPKGMADDMPWHRQLGQTGLIVNMVIDHPKHMAYVTTSLVEKSRRGIDEWLESARSNLLAQTPAGYLESINDEVDIRIGCKGDAYDAARALILDELVPNMTKYGFFVAVPSRDLLVVQPVTAKALIHVHALKRFAADHYEKQPYPISDEVYWIRRGEWVRFPIEITKDSIRVMPPDEFVEEVMNRMSPEELPGDESDDGGMPA
jgi:hypothetical protein